MSETWINMRKYALQKREIYKKMLVVQRKYAKICGVSRTDFP